MTRWRLPWGARLGVRAIDWRTIAIGMLCCALGVVAIAAAMMTFRTGL